MSIDKLISPYVNQIEDEINNNFSNKYVIDTYKHLLDFNTHVKEDLEFIERPMITYLIKEATDLDLMIDFYAW